MNASASCQQPAPPALQLQRVAHHYGRTRALCDFTLSVNQGELICICGPSGCGKSTLLRLIAGIEVLQAGRIDINGAVVADGGCQHTPPEARNVGLVFQDYALFPHLTVRQNIAFGLPRKQRAQHRQQVEQTLARLNMQDLADRYPHTLSSGQQQRVALLRALAPQPRVLLLDEPFSALDRHLRERLGQETTALLRQLRITTLMVTHELEESMLLADRIVILNQGRMVQSGSPQEIYTAPKAAFVFGLFGAANELQAVVQGGMAVTAIGEFPARGFADNTAVRVLIRASDISVAPLAPTAGQPAGAATAEVCQARLLGAVVALQLALDGGKRQAIQAHIPESLISELPMPVTPTARVALSVRPGRAYVFPATAE